MQFDSTPPGTPAVVRRTSLPEQTVQVLREGLLTGRWRKELPSEAQLCRELHVSRMTLRKAIRQLADEQHLTLGGHGRRHRIHTTPVAMSLPTGRIIRILTPEPLFNMGAVHLVMMESLREKLGGSGYSVEIEFHPKIFSNRDPKELSRLDELPGTVAWVIFSSTEHIQQWFAENRRPCVVVGPLFPGIELPCIVPDTTASARHVVGLFSSRGHRDLAYFTRKQTTLGDRKGAVAFAAEAELARVNMRIVTHSSEPEQIRRKLDAQLASHSPPTAYFSNCAEDALTILCHLQHAGFKIPAGVSIVAGWDDLFLHHAVPSIACYRVDGAKIGRSLANLLQQQIESATRGNRRIAIIPEFIPGGSIRQA